MSSRNSIFFILIAVILSLAGCITHKDLLSLQQKKNDTLVTSVSLLASYKVQPGDILDIRVSSIDPQSVAIFNKDIANSKTNQINPASTYLNGYSVTDSGTIDLPFIGAIKVGGLQLTQIKDTVEKKMIPYYKFSSVDIKLMSFRVTVLGEVTSQGTYYVYNDQANILQVLGMAGGITDLGNRKKIRIIRKTNEKNELVYVDISNEDITKSRYYYLQPNDIIYVEPLKVKVVKLNSPSIQVALSALTFIIVFLNFINNK